MRASSYFIGAYVQCSEGEQLNVRPSTVIKQSYSSFFASASFVPYVASSTINEKANNLPSAKSLIDERGIHQLGLSWSPVLTFHPQVALLGLSVGQPIT